MTPIEDVVSGPKLPTDAQEPQRASTRPYLEDGLTTVWTEHVQDVLANEPVRRDDSLVSKVYEIGKKSVNDIIDQWFYDPVTAEAVAMDSVLMNALSPWRKVGKIQRAGKTLLGKAAKRVGEDVAHKAGSSRAPTSRNSGVGSAPSTRKPSLPDGARSSARGKQPAPQSSAKAQNQGYKRLEPKLSCAQNVNAQKALHKKLRALQKAQRKTARVRHLPDGRIRYYTKEKPSRTPGPTRGASYVTEYNPASGRVKSWYECYDHKGTVSRAHPKNINGQDIIGQHYPLTEAELSSFHRKPEGLK